MFNILVSVPSESLFHSADEVGTPASEFERALEDYLSQR